MKLTRVVIVLVGLLVAGAHATFQSDEDLQINFPPTERIAPPSNVVQHFRSHDNLSTGWNTVIRTQWIKIGRAKCDDRCVDLCVFCGESGSITYDAAKEEGTASGKIRFSWAPNSAGFIRARVGLAVPSGCSNYMPYFEMRDEKDHEFAYHDPHEHLVPHSRVHVHRFTNGIGSIVFQNENTTYERLVRMGALLTCS